MSETKHTPGPWKAVNRQYHSRLGICDDWGVVSERGDDLLELFGNDGYDEPREIPAEANAHLIAAAPNMLEALQYVVGNGFLPEGGDERSALSRCRAAIAKAEGK